MYWNSKEGLSLEFNYVFVAMRYLVMSPSLLDFLKAQLISTSIYNILLLLALINYLCSGWFLDGRTSILVTKATSAYYTA